MNKELGEKLYLLTTIHTEIWEAFKQYDDEIEIVIPAESVEVLKKEGKDVHAFAREALLDQIKQDILTIVSDYYNPYSEKYIGNVDN